MALLVHSAFEMLLLLGFLNHVVSLWKITGFGIDCQQYAPCQPMELSHRKGGTHISKMPSHFVKESNDAGGIQKTIRHCIIYLLQVQLILWKQVL
jgi:hypothetical protein